MSSAPTPTAPDVDHVPLTDTSSAALLRMCDNRAVVLVQTYVGHVECTVRHFRQMFGRTELLCEPIAESICRGLSD